MNAYKIAMSENPDKAYNKKFGKLYLKRAKGNLYSSRILLKEKQYADSVFLLQQSVEKTLKGYALYTGILERKDFEQSKGDSSKKNKKNRLIGRGHNLFPIFERMLEKSKLRLEKIKDNCQKEPDFYNVMNITSEKIDHQLSELESGLKKLHEIEETALELKISDTQIQRYLKDIVEINRNIEKFLQQIQPFRGTPLGKIGEIIVKQIREVKILANAFQLLILTLKVKGTLLNLSIILKSHVNTSRYPDVDLDFDPDEFYTDSLPLICHFNEIQEATEKCLGDIESYIAITESIY